MSIVAPARAGEMEGGRRIDRPLLDDDRFIGGGSLRDPRELQGDAGGAVGRVVGVVLMRATTLHMRGRAPGCTCLGRGRQKRCHALGRQREAGGQNEDTRTWAAEAAKHAVHHEKLAKGNLTVMTLDERRACQSLRGAPAKRSSSTGRSRRLERRNICAPMHSALCSACTATMIRHTNRRAEVREGASAEVRGAPSLAPRGDHGRHRYSHPSRSRRRPPSPT